jgi:DsbE subfamily thiol:disulfide oxidoreductase
VIRRGVPALGLAFVLLVATGCAPDDRGAVREAPRLSGEDLTGTVRNLDDLSGDVVLVTVWASWCAPCRDEMPEIQRLYDEHGGDGFTVLGIDFRDTDAAARALVEEVGVTYPSIADPRGTTSVEWGIIGVPQSFLVDGDGIIVARQLGAVTPEWVREKVMPEIER